MEGDGRKDEKANLVPDSNNSTLSLTTVSDRGFGLRTSASDQQDPSVLAAQQLALHNERAEHQSYLSRLFNPLCKDDRSKSNLESALAAYQKGGNIAENADALRRLNEAIVQDQAAMRQKEQISTYGTGFLKTMMLFSRFKGATAAVYAFDQANPGEGLNLQLTDATLGAAKGLALNYVFNKAGAADLGVATKAVTLGVGSRAADTLLTRQTYFDASGNASLSHAWQAAKDNIANPTLLASDIVFFGLAQGLVKSGNALSRGFIEHNPLANTVATAGSFGLIAGGSNDVHRQLAEGKTYATLDPWSVLKSAGIQGSLDMLAGVPGGMRAGFESRNQMRTYEEALRQARAATTGDTISDTGLSGMMARLDMPIIGKGGGGRGQEKLPPLWQVSKDAAMEHVYNNREGVKAAVRSPLQEIEPIDDFAGRMIKGTEKWTDLSALDSDAALKRVVMREHQYVMQDLVNRDIIRLNELQHPRLVQEKLRDDPEHMNQYVEYLKASHQYSEAIGKLNKEFDARLNELNIPVAEFARLQGLPGPRLEKLITEGAAASYRAGTGRVQLRGEDIISNENPHVVSERLYHEFTHFEQDVTIIRNLADKLGIAVTPTKAQQSELFRTYQEATGNILSPEFMDNVMASRNGVRLSADQADRAEMLASSFLHNQPVTEFLRQSANDYRLIERLIKGLDGRNGAYVTVAKLANEGPTYLFRVFGSTEFPPWMQTHVNNFRAYEAGEFDPWLDMQAPVKTDIQTRLRQRLDAINVERSEKFADYMQPHEQEAWLLGHWAELRTANWRATTGGEGR